MVQPLFGFILFKPFPTLELAWVTHPGEAVSSTGGVWTQPFADLSDVARIDLSNERATLVLSEAAARRADRLSDAHGHRVYRLRGAGIADADDLGTYTWMAGLRTVPGVRTTFTCRLPRRDDQWKEGVTLGFLHQRFEVHATARELLRTELGLDADVSWTVSEAAPHFSEPLLGWVLYGPEDGGIAAQAPWFREASGAPRQWLSLASPNAQPFTAPVPQHWEMDRGREPRLVARAAASAAEQAQEEVFCGLLRRNLGRELAVLVQGEVVAVAPIERARPAGLSLTRLSPAAGSRLASLWESANPAPPMGAAPSPTPAEAATALPDLFQVRLMAEPQDRKLIPVTHFAAPGSPGGVVVAVQNEIILDGRSVADVALEQKANSVYLRLTLTPEGQEALDGACFSNMGKQLAIVYDGRLLSAPTIDDWEHFELAFKGLDEDWPERLRRA